MFQTETVARRCVLAAAAFVMACGGGSSGGGFIDETATSTAFSAGLLPIAITGTGSGAGHLGFNASGDLLVPGQDRDTFFEVSREDGSVRTLAVGVEDVISVTGGGDGSVFAGTSTGRFFRTGIPPGLVELNLTFPGPPPALLSLDIAPDDFGLIGGWPIAGTVEGLYAIGAGGDPAIPVTPFLISPAFTASDIAFGDDGTLFATDYDTGEIVIIDEFGGMTTFATGFTSPDGIDADVDEDGEGTLYVADSGTDTLSAVTVPGGAVTTIGDYDFDASFFASGVALDGNGNLVLGTGATDLVLRGVSVPGFDPAGFPVAIADATHSAGGLTFDGESNLIGTANDGADATNRVFRIAPDGALSDLVFAVGDASFELTSILHTPSAGFTYVGTTDGRVLRIDREGEVSTFINTGADSVVTALTLAAVGAEDLDAGSLIDIGGRLMVATDTLGVIAVGYVGLNSSSRPVLINLFTLPGPSPVSGMVWPVGRETPPVANFIWVVTNDGTVRNMVERFWPINGFEIVVAPGPLVNPVGVAIDESGARLFVADAGDDMLKQVAIPGGAVSNLVSLDYLGGASSSGVAFDGLGSVFSVVGTGSASVARSTVFP